MNEVANLSSFMEIFRKNIVTKIVIPKIQRDYAQGRDDKRIEGIRNRFLKELRNAIKEKKFITLDFIYGDVDENKTMTPLDGQQRLTTLFLLHWYAAKKESISETEYDFLKKFSYETRPSARDFCEQLINFTPSFGSRISEEIINQNWFPYDWEKDPTIKSMLIMLDAIDENFRDVDGIWNILESGVIRFYFLPLHDMGLTDELYIKMNSRGKPLSDFEHFKAEFERRLRKIDEICPNLSKDIIKKIDCDWTDFLWQYRDKNKEDDVIDERFLRYFNFICNIIYCKKGKAPRNELANNIDDLIVLLDELFSDSDALENIKIMESFFDCWKNIKIKPADFFDEFVTAQHQTDANPEKIRADYAKTNINFDALQKYLCDDEQPAWNLTVFLYAVICYLQKTNTITREQFNQRIRIINNLIKNSEDALSNRSDNSSIPNIIKQTEYIIENGTFDDGINGRQFNQNQIDEEKAKIEYIKNHQEDVLALYNLENQELLDGQISILGLENIHLWEKFIQLFKCDWGLVDCALMSVGDYGQKKKDWCYLYGHKTNKLPWKTLFHKSSNTGFEEKTKHTLVQLLSKKESFSDVILQQIINEFLNDCETNNEYPFRYYYVKYYNDFFEDWFEGKLANQTVLEKGAISKEEYNFLVIKSKPSLYSSYVPFFKLVDETKLGKGIFKKGETEDIKYYFEYGDDKCIVNTDTSYIIKHQDANIDDVIITINQNEQGIDTENRVEKLKKYITENPF